VQGEALRLPHFLVIRFQAFGPASFVDAIVPFAWIIPVAASPNKPPEPTTFAVTSRAIVRVIEMKQQIPDCGAARAEPAKVVAHL
jgi:hypothetical protein